MYLFILALSPKPPWSHLGFPGGLDGKESASNAGDLGSIPGWEDPLEKEMATHFSVLAWRIPWTEEPGGLQFTQCCSQTWLSDFHVTLSLYTMRDLNPYPPVVECLFKTQTSGNCIKCRSKRRMSLKNCKWLFPEIANLRNRRRNRAYNYCAL